ncbi:tellurite resistance TerB family protein [Yoonia vestfoldensis]|uniref:tellurite resistance TerB family protein n=1 Tax=Yoonia vestfoldensis TaxID=245188 RepID=UPI0013A5B47E|nr:TerB family tellurite resistance protein [Yoonia vestfoldensis]
MTNENGPLALCHLVETRSAIYVNYWRAMQGYALAANNCDTDMYRPLDAADLKVMQDAGMISADIPSVPKMSVQSLVGGFWGLGVFGVLALLAGLKVLQTQKRRGQRLAMMGNATPGAQAILDAMCHTAKADGYIAPSEVEVIKFAAEEMTGKTFPLAHVKQMATLAKTDLVKNDYKQLIKGRSKMEQLDIMRGVLMVVAADGRMEGKEKTFVGNLAQTMGMDGLTLQNLLADVVADTTRNPSPA